VECRKGRGEIGYGPIQSVHPLLVYRIDHVTVASSSSSLGVVVVMVTRQVRAQCPDDDDDDRMRFHDDRSEKNRQFAHAFRRRMKSLSTISNSVTR